MNNILKYITSSIICLLFWNTTLYAQADSLNVVRKDSIKIKEKYGLRAGIDISKLIRTVLEEDYEGFAIEGDYRLSKFIYLAGEFGSENKTNNTDFYETTTKGTYFKAGVDYNAYRNWLDMENLIYGGLRIGASTFNQTLNSYTIYHENQYWKPQYTTSESQNFNGLSALWAELIIGIKAEVLNNLYLGVHVEFKGMLTQNEPSNFQNLYVPGFNKTYDSVGLGFGYGYSISYLIPLYKKDK